MCPSAQGGNGVRPGKRCERIAYVPGDSFLHRLYPLTKAAWLVGGTALVFLIRNPWVVAAAVGLLLASSAAAGLRLGRVRGTRLFLATALTLGLLQAVFLHEGELVWQAGPLRITAGGVQAGIYVAGRFLSVILLSYLFVLTTDPNDLAYALMRAGLPYRYGFALITALRLVPRFEQEGQIIYQAQLARGVQYDLRSPRRLLLLARQFFLPLLVSALGTVDGLAVSMEGRCFGKYPTRTFLRQARPGWADAAALVLLAALVAGTIWLRVA